ncbi:NUDIX hydrolase [Aliiroseovarius sediminis]|uniref:NUDIX domain-containing protein n=1 Tax=Aliiroseovarius sediminis TaxID=2925839 RepID=UPI001F5772DE|nr:NUDIX hydrolase [Aliiroseovarius sediminis]MCI2395253.1 NUDIX hydrolase [Aliiroseovarius sediminis]
MSITFNTPRLAVRALLLHENRLLMVNAYGGRKSGLLCLPGGGVEPGTSLHDNLTREVHEETGLGITVGDPALVNEFHDPDSGFHQVEIVFRCTLVSGRLDPGWQDPEAIVTDRRWVTHEQIAGLHFRPLSLPALAWGDPKAAPSYDALEAIVR